MMRLVVHLVEMLLMPSRNFMPISWFVTKLRWGRENVSYPNIKVTVAIGDVTVGAEDAATMMEVLNKFSEKTGLNINEATSR